MLKIMVVDDEAPTREWINFCLQKQGHDVTTYMCKNGKEALEVFMKERPDVVIADIEMPVMNGLVMAEEIHKRSPQTPIIIFTSHSKFEYARGAMKSGATEFILKSEISQELLWEAIEKQLNILKLSGNKLEVQLKQFRRNVLFNRVVSEHEVGLEELESFAFNEIGIEGQCFFALAIQLEIEVTEFQYSLEELSEHLKSKNVENIYGFPIEDEKYIFLIVFNKVYSSQGRNSKNIFEIAYSFNHYYQCALGVSGLYSNHKNLAKSVREAIQQLNLSFYNGTKRIFQMSGSQGGDQKNAAIKKDRFHRKIENFIDEIAYNKEFNLNQFINDYDLFLKKEKLEDIQSVKSASLKILYALISYKGMGVLSPTVREDIEKQMMDTSSIEQLKDMMGTQCLRINQLDSHGSKKLSKSIVLAKEYINDHFCDNISLTDVAEKVGLSPEYLSRFFKSEMGISYSEYLLNLRMAKAEYLLNQTDMKVYEIAKNVGYPNISYFSTLFKKRFGLNPFNYRNR